MLWKLGTLPPGLITFYNKTEPLDKHWHVLGMGYNPNVDLEELNRWVGVWGLGGGWGWEVEGEGRL